MNCNEVRELILTDYIDDQMEGDARVSIESHLAHCPGCKKFYAEAKEISAEFFAGAEKTDLPAYVWQRIKERIVADQSKKPGFAEIFFEKLKYVFYIPRPAFALATILTMILIFGAVTGLIYNKQRLPGPGAPEQIEYFDYIGQAPPDSLANGSAGFGTAVEQYFL